MGSQLTIIQNRIGSTGEINECQNTNLVRPRKCQMFSKCILLIIRDSEKFIFFFFKGRTFQITKNAVATIQIITISAYCGFSYGLLFHKYMYFICFSVGHSRISRKLITFISANVQPCINKHFLIPTFCSHYISFHPSIHTAP